MKFWIWMLVISFLVGLGNMTQMPHKGKTNVYNLTKDGKTYTMTSLVGEPKDKGTPSTIMLVGEKKYLKGLKEDNMPCFSIVVKLKENIPRKEK